MAFKIKSKENNSFNLGSKNNKINNINNNKEIINNNSNTSSENNIYNDVFRKIKDFRIGISLVFILVNILYFYYSFGVKY